MGRIQWKKDKIFSLELRNGTFALLQMLDDKGRVAVFNQFRDNDNWDELVLDKSMILFKAYIIGKSIFKRSNVNVQIKIDPLVGLEFPQIRINSGYGNRKKKFWERTENEIELFIEGTGDNMLSERIIKNGKTDYIYTDIKLEDYNKYEDLEMEVLRIYPEFNEQLLLCSIMGKNIDPLKELAFNRPLDIQCKTYVDILSGKVLLSELGY